ncbi:MAG: metal-dependent hydrolase [Candidatus Woesearchaeota archaeon]
MILTIVLVDLYRHYVAKNSFSRAYVLIAGIAGLLPDADVPLSWFVSFFNSTSVWLHRTYTHAVVWAALFALIAIVIHFHPKMNYFKFTRKQTTLFFAMLSVGWLMHVILDCSISGSETISWIPLIAQIGFCPRWITDPNVAAGLDAIILLAWLIHEETKHYIRDYF